MPPTTRPTTKYSFLSLPKQVVATVVAVSFTALTLPASAQPQPQDPAEPPPGFEQQPPAAQQPPPVYGQPPPQGPYYGQPYGQPPPGYGYGPGPMMGPKTMDYEDGDPVPPGYHVDTKMRKGLFITGVALFGGFYLISVFVASLAVDSNLGGNDNFVPLYIPAVGPFVTVGSAQAEGGGAFLLILDGVVQCGGIAMAILGLALQKSELVRNDVGSTDVRLSPMVVGRDLTGTPTMGFGLVGSM
jgi:hypothetical protein